MNYIQLIEALLPVLEKILAALTPPASGAPTHLMPPLPEAHESMEHALAHVKDMIAQHKAALLAEETHD